MTLSAIDLGNAVNSLVVRNRGASWNWAEECERHMFYCFWVANRGGAGNGDGIPTQRSAIAAYKVSGIEGHDTNPPAGAAVFNNKSSFGHVRVSIGNGWAINTSPLTRNQSVLDFGHGAYISRIDGYYPETYLGWSYNDAGRGLIDVAAWAPAPSSGGATPIPGQPARWVDYRPVASVQARVQRGLKNRGRYSGAVDGVWGANNIKGIQITAQKFGYTGPLDGVLGPHTIIAVQKYAAHWGGYRGAIDGQAGPATWEGFARGLGA